jgi:hypothetical protein
MTSEVEKLKEIFPKVNFMFIADALHRNHSVERAVDDLTLFIKFCEDCGMSEETLSEDAVLPEAADEPLDEPSDPVLQIMEMFPDLPRSRVADALTLCNFDADSAASFLLNPCESMAPARRHPSRAPTAVSGWAEFSRRHRVEAGPKRKSNDPPPPSSAPASANAPYLCEMFRGIFPPHQVSEIAKAHATAAAAVDRQTDPPPPHAGRLLELAAERQSPPHPLRRDNSLRGAPHSSPRQRTQWREISRRSGSKSLPPPSCRPVAPEGAPMERKPLAYADVRAEANRLRALERICAVSAWSAHTRGDAMRAHAQSLKVMVV